jgi:hypothetical protein
LVPKHTCSPCTAADYVDILRAFVQSQSAGVDNLSLDRIYRGSIVVDAPLSIGDCVPDGMASDLKGQVVVLRPDILLPEYRAASHQIFLAQGGFGCSPEARGRSIFGTNLYSGEQERWNRGDILGVVAETTLPGWAFEKLERLREPREKESVLAKLQAAKNNSASPKTEESRQKKPREPKNIEWTSAHISSTGRGIMLRPYFFVLKGHGNYENRPQFHWERHHPRRYASGAENLPG